MFVTIHLMNRGEKLLEELPSYSNVTLGYELDKHIFKSGGEELSHYGSAATAEMVPYEYFEERD